MSGFSQCIYGGQQAIKYYHDYGDFEFFLMQAEDGTQAIRYVTPVKLTERSVKAIGEEAMRTLKRTAVSLKCDISSDVLTFDEALSTIQKAEAYARGLRPAR